MAARGVADIISKISSEEEEDDASLWRKKFTSGEEISRRLVRDHRALVEALRREKAWGVNEV
jgi:predicted transcriptional regulator